MKNNIVLLHKDKTQLELIEQAYEIVIKCQKHNHKYIPGFIVNYARLKEVI